MTKKRASTMWYEYAIARYGPKAIMHSIDVLRPRASPLSALTLEAALPMRVVTAPAPFSGKSKKPISVRRIFSKTIMRILVVSRSPGLPKP